jgi:uncharacterized protein (DUF1330 family)
MPAYVAVQVVIEDPVSYERYKKLTPGSLEPFGGRFLARGGATEALEGTWKPERFVLLEFPSAERARAWWSSPEYAEAKKLRQASATTQMLLIEGVG